jgi:hypothetical protein
MIRYVLIADYFLEEFAIFACLRQQGTQVMVDHPQTIELTPVTFTAVVAPMAGAKAPPAGSVQFWGDGKPRESFRSTQGSGDVDDQQDRGLDRRGGRAGIDHENELAICVRSPHSRRDGHEVARALERERDHRSSSNCLN